MIHYVGIWKHLKIHESLPKNVKIRRNLQFQKKITKTTTND